MRPVSILKLIFYDRHRFCFSSIHVEENIDTIKNFVLKKIIRIKKSTRGKKYLIKWKGYDSEKNAWKNFQKWKTFLIWFANTKKNILSRRINHLKNEIVSKKIRNCFFSTPHHSIKFNFANEFVLKKIFNHNFKTFHHSNVVNQNDQKKNNENVIRFFVWSRLLRLKIIFYINIS